MGAYDVAGGYASARREDPRIAALIRSALGDARSLVNVGAGAGNYEPPDLDVVAIEPSAAMIAQRPPGAAPAVQASAEALPLPDDAVDAGMAILTLHHWDDVEAGLRELRRVVRGRIVILHWEPALAKNYWLVKEYLPQIAAWERDVPTPRRIGEMLDQPIVVLPVPIPHDCTDGFLGAFWRRPEQYLDPVARASISSLAALGDRLATGLLRLHADLESGAWQRRHADLLELDECDLGYRLVIASDE